MVASTLAPLTTAIDALLAVDTDLLDDTDIHTLVVALGRQTARLEAAHCRMINRWDRRHVWADNGSKSPGARLARQTRMRKSDAHRLVHRARALEAMPAATKAYTAGEITGAHVDLVARCDRTWRNTTFAESEAVLVDSCKTPWFDNARRAIDYWKQLADRDTCDDDAELDREGRHASMAIGWRGVGVLNAVFDPVAAETFRTELDRLGERLRLQDQHDGTVRTVQQRRCDALVEMATRSASAPAGGLRPRPLFTVTIGIDPFNHLCETAAGTVIAPGLLIPLLSDADIERIVYDPPNRTIEASHRRTFTGALRRIIEIRDRHCQHESGCDIPAYRCDIDHIVPYSEGGITSLCNGQLLCATHNRITKNHSPRPPLTKRQATANHSQSRSTPTNVPRGRPPPTPTRRPRYHPERRHTPDNPRPAQPRRSAPPDPSARAPAPALRTLVAGCWQGNLSPLVAAVAATCPGPLEIRGALAPTPSARR